MTTPRRPGTAARAALLLTALSLIPLTRAAGQGTCPGDCNGNNAVAINELITSVNIVLGRAQLSACMSVDGNGNGTVTINELIAAVAASLDGCGGGDATFAEVQAIFTEKCATLNCHGSGAIANDLSLNEGEAYDEIVGVEPFNIVATDMGLLRVDAGDALNSYLYLKVAGPLPLGLGSQMPLLAEPLSEDEVATIRDWIDAGAEP